MKRRIKVLLAIAAIAAAILVAYQQAWSRVEVGPDQMAVLFARFGDAPPPGQVLAAEGQRGVRARVLGPGRHYINPFREYVEIHPVVHVPAGEGLSKDQEGRIRFGTPPMIGVVTSLEGDPLAEGRFLAEEGEQGIRRRVLTPGKYLLNPYAYQVELHPATILEAGTVGVVIHLAGENTAAEFAAPHQRGVQREVLPPGLYYLNPREYEVAAVAVGYRELTFENDTAISFPAADSNTVNVDATVVWGLRPSDAPHLIRQFGSAELVVDRLIRPTCESVVRLAGSDFKARQFVEGDTRREFQERVQTDLTTALLQKHVRVLLTLVRRTQVPELVRKPIQEAKVAEEKDLTWQVQTETSKIRQQLMEVQGAVETEAARVLAETERLVFESFGRGKVGIQALQSRTDADAQEVQSRIDQLRVQNSSVVGVAEAEAQAILGQAEAEGERLMVEAFGDGQAYALWRFARGLPEDLKIDLTESSAVWKELAKRLAVGGGGK